MSRRLPAWAPPPAQLAIWAVTRWLLIADLPNMAGRDGVMDLTRRWVSTLLAGDNPYDVPGTGYPPAAMLGFAGIGPTDLRLERYRYAFAIALLAVDLLGLLVAWAAERGGRRHAGLAYAIAVPLMGPVLLLWRYDLLPAVLSLAALACVFANRPAPAWWLLGVSIAFKPYTAVLVPVLAIWEWRGAAADAVRVLAGRLLPLLAPSVVAALAIMPWAGFDWLEVYGFQATRELTLDSTPAVAMTELSKLGIGDQAVAPDGDCLCLVRTGEHADLLRTLFTGALLVALAGLYTRLARSPVTPERVAATAAAALIALVLAYPVFSPQYAIWVLVPLVLLAGSRDGVLALVLAAMATLLAAYSYPLNYQHVTDYDTLGRLIVLGRIAALAGALWFTWRLAGARSVPLPSRRSR